MVAHPTRLIDWLQYIRAEFEEPSDLRVTIDEACARWPLELPRLSGLLDALVLTGYLKRAANGTYFRRPPDPGDDPTRLPPVAAPRAARRPPTAG